MKEKASIIIKNGHIITMDTEQYVFRGSIAIDGSRIVSVGSSGEIEKKYVGDEVIDASYMAVMPGLIDCHTHDLQILLRQWQKPVRLPRWLNLLIPFESVLTKEEAYLSGLVACINNIRMGVTCHVDHGGQFNADEVGKAIDKTGVRGILSRSTIDMNVPDNLKMSTEEALNENVRLVERWNDSANGRIRALFSLRQIMVCTTELWMKIKEQAAKLKVGIQTHLAEGIYEVDWTFDHYGRRPVVYLFDIGFLGSEVIITHMMYLTDREVQMAREKEVKIIYCPTGNLSRTRVPQMLAMGIPVGIATDGGSRGNLDLFEEMRIASAVQRAQEIPHYDNIALSENDLLSMATINGARAILWEKEIGSIEAGKKADIILINLKKSHIQPIADIKRALVHRVQGSDVDTTIIDGKVVMEHGRIKTVDEQKILEEVEDKAPEIASRLKL